MTNNAEIDDRPVILELLRRADVCRRANITALGLQNFQAIVGPTFIPLAPLTLLYGPNSGGKSSIGDAMRALSSSAKADRNVPIRQMLDRWANFNRFSEKRARRPFVRQPSAVGFWIVVGAGEYEHLFGHESLNMLSMETVDTPATRLFSNQPFAVRWLMDRDDGARPQEEMRAANFAIWVGSDSADPLLEVRAEHGADEVRTYANIRLNPAHALFSMVDDLWQGVAPTEYSLKSCLVGTPSAAEFNWFEIGDFEWDESEPRRIDIIGVDDGFDETEQLMLGFFANLIDGCMQIVGTLCLAEIVPPIRKVPAHADSTFVLMPGHATSELRKLVADGEFVTVPAWSQVVTEPWRELARDAVGLGYRGDREGVFSFVNELIGRESMLGLGYRLHARGFQFGPGVGKRVRKIARVDGGEPGDIAHIVHLNLLDERSNEVEIEDVGTGVSQLIPVLVALYSEGRLIVHQPELHLHPRLQSVLGDILLARRSHTYACTIVESHSEHLLLRVLRRMRESADGTSSQMPYRIGVEDLVVLYFDKDDEGVTDVKVLRVDGRGEFLDRWPHGFFTERDEDLDAFAV